jgi:WD40 repeat protein
MQPQDEGKQRAATHPTGAGGAQDASDGIPADPVLRIETGLHGGVIRRIDTDESNRFAVTASDDKTVRMWSLPDGRLLRVLRLPLGLPLDFGDVGKAFAVAISPDGGTVAVGGWTRIGPHQNCIFLFDRGSGELTKRLADVPTYVNHLAYSPDGRRLVASLARDIGIRVFDAGQGYRLLPSDGRYGDSSYSAAFDRAGRLVTASDDGVVRLYAAGRYEKPIAHFRSGGHLPYAAAFSPDGTRVAVCFEDAPKVVVLSGSDLIPLFEADTTGIDEGLLSVGWSQDGRFLFAGGKWHVNDIYQVRRWSEGGGRPFADIAAGSALVIQILELTSGSMLRLRTASG